MSAGGVLVMMLVIFSMFMVIMIAMISYINRQFHETVDQEQREKIFHIAESGVDYTVAELNGGVVVPDDLLGFTERTVNINDPVSGDVIGVFKMSYSTLVGDGVSLESTGYDASGEGKCAKIVADIQRISVNQPYTVVLWDRSVSCP